MVTAMNYWLVKSEPGSWSWDQQVDAGAKGTPWTGVRNHTAKQNLMKMKKGDRAFFYHSGEGKEIVGIAEVVRESYPDPTAEPGEPWVVVDVKAVTRVCSTGHARRTEDRLPDGLRCVISHDRDVRHPQTLPSVERPLRSHL